MYPCCGGDLNSQGCKKYYDCCNQETGGKGCKELKEADGRRVSVL